MDTPISDITGLIADPGPPAVAAGHPDFDTWARSDAGQHWARDALAACKRTLYLQRVWWESYDAAIGDDEEREVAHDRMMVRVVASLAAARARRMAREHRAS